MVIRMDVKTNFNRIWYAPTLSGLIANRREGLILAGAAGVHLGLYMAGLPAWACPVRAATGIPCPGCGLTTATGQLLHGEFVASFQTHAFAPVFLVGSVLLMVATLLPGRYHKRAMEAISRFESRTGILSWVLSGLVFYWGARLIGFIPFNIPGY